MKRNETLDIVKGITIIIVVALHASMPISWMTLFQMPVFFIVAGFCYSSSATESLSTIKKYILKRVRSLYIPCVIFSISITLLHNVLLNMNIISGSQYSVKNYLIQIGKAVIFSGGGNLSGTIWFLRTMFIASLIYMMIDKITRDTKNAAAYRWGICVVSLLIGWGAYYFRIPGNQYFNSFTVLFMYEFGRNIRKYEIRFLYPGHKKQYPVIINIILIICSGAALWGLNFFVHNKLNRNVISQPIGLVIGTVLGWIFVVAVSNILLRLFPKKFPVYLGQHTLPVMLLHFSCFKLVTLFQIIIYHEEMTKLSSFPCLYTDNCWWIAYTIAGVFIPLLLYMAYYAVKISIQRAYSKRNQKKAE